MMQIYRETRTNGSIILWKIKYTSPAISTIAFTRYIYWKIPAPFILFTILHYNVLTLISLECIRILRNTDFLK